MTKSEKYIWLLNALIIGACIFISVVYCKDINWAHAVLFDYVDDSIPSSEDRSAYRKAAYHVQNRTATEEHQATLVETAEIDPNSEARFWLAEYNFNNKEFDKALKNYLLFIERDPSWERAFINAANILSQKGKREEAVSLLEKGIAYQRQMVEEGRPVMDRTVYDRYNKKAAIAHKTAKAALSELLNAKNNLKN